MASELKRFRNYARERANWQPPVRPKEMSTTCYRGHIYGGCHRSPTRCGCSCHDVLGPTDADRALFARLADEIDGYLARDPEVCQVAPEDDMPLWGEDAEASK